MFKYNLYIYIFFNSFLSFLFVCAQDEKNQVLMTNAWLQLVGRSLRRAQQY